MDSGDIHKRAAPTGSEFPDALFLLHPPGKEKSRPGNRPSGRGTRHRSDSMLRKEPARSINLQHPLVILRFEENLILRLLLRETEQYFLQVDSRQFRHHV